MADAWLSKRVVPKGFGNFSCQPEAGHDKQWLKKSQGPLYDSQKRAQGCQVDSWSNQS
jgi:hypothetical protein